MKYTELLGYRPTYEPQILMRTPGRKKRNVRKRRSFPGQTNAFSSLFSFDTSKHVRFMDRITHIYRKKAERVIHSRISNVAVERRRVEARATSKAYESLGLPSIDQGTDDERGIETKVGQTQKTPETPQTPTVNLNKQHNAQTDTQIIPEAAAIPNTNPIPEAAAIPNINPIPEAAAIPNKTPIPEAAAIPNINPIPEAAAIPNKTPIPEAAAIPNINPIPEAAAIPNKTPIPEAAAIANINLIPEAAAIAKVTSFPQADAIPNIKPVSQADAIPNIKPVSQADAIPNIKPVSQADAIPNITPIPQGATEPSVQLIPYATARVGTTPIIQPFTNTRSAIKPIETALDPLLLLKQGSQKNRINVSLVYVCNSKLDSSRLFRGAMTRHRPRTRKEPDEQHYYDWGRGGEEQDSPTLNFLKYEVEVSREKGSKSYKKYAHSDSGRYRSGEYDDYPNSEETFGKHGGRKDYDMQYRSSEYYSYPPSDEKLPQYDGKNYRKRQYGSPEYGEYTNSRDTSWRYSSRNDYGRRNSDYNRHSYSDKRLKKYDSKNYRKRRYGSSEYGGYTNSRDKSWKSSSRNDYERSYQSSEYNTYSPSEERRAKYHGRNYRKRQYGSFNFRDKYRRYGSRNDHDRGYRSSGSDSHSYSKHDTRDDEERGYRSSRHSYLKHDSRHDEERYADSGLNITEHDVNNDRRHKRSAFDEHTPGTNMMTYDTKAGHEREYQRYVEEPYSGEDYGGYDVKEQESWPEPSEHVVHVTPETIVDQDYNYHKYDSEGYQEDNDHALSEGQEGHGTDIYIRRPRQQLLSHIGPSMHISCVGT